jgi:hypothetical protein
MLATMLPSHAGYGTARATWPRRDVDAEPCLATMLSCHAGDGATGSTWPRRDVDVETC